MYHVGGRRLAGEDGGVVVQQVLLEISHIYVHQRRGG